MATLFPDRQWRQHLRRFVQEHFWLDTLQLGQLLLLVLALFTLLLLLMCAFCCCLPFNTNKARRRNSKARAGAAGIAANVNRTPTTGFSSTNEERRRLLQQSSVMVPKPSTTANHGFHERGQSSGENIVAEQLKPELEQIEIERRVEEEEEEKRKAMETKEATAPVNMAIQKQEECAMARQTSDPPPQRRYPQPLTPYVGYRRPLVEQSPPPPRRLAPSCGRTQVVPLTGLNQRRVPVLMLLMADQEQQQHPYNNQQRHAGGGGNKPTGVVGTPDSRTTTNGGTGGKSCSTIPEDAEGCELLMGIGSNNNEEELMSIDRTLLSNSTTIVNSSDDVQQQQQQQPAPVRNSVRLASPFPQPPPEFELPVPTYSPPEPPSPPSEVTCRLAVVNNGTGTMERRSNLSSPNQSSYGGGQSPLNTTTGSSGSIVLGGPAANNARVDASAATGNYGRWPATSQVQISELECSDAGIPPPPCSSSPALANGPHSQQNQHAHQLGMMMAHQQVHFGILAGGHVPRSISQQLELMELAEAAAAEQQQQQQ